MITVGRKIRYLRQQYHMTQKELGLALGFSQSAADIRIAQDESGQVPSKFNFSIESHWFLKLIPLSYRWIFQKQKANGK